MSSGAPQRSAAPMCLVETSATIVIASAQADFRSSPCSPSRQSENATNNPADTAPLSTATPSAIEGTMGTRKTKARQSTCAMRRFSKLAHNARAIEKARMSNAIQTTARYSTSAAPQTTSAMAHGTAGQCPIIDCGHMKRHAVSVEFTEGCQSKVQQMAPPTAKASEKPNALARPLFVSDAAPRKTMMVRMSAKSERSAAVMDTQSRTAALPFQRSSTVSESSGIERSA